MIRFTEDLAVLAEHEWDLEVMLEEMDCTLVNYNMHINKRKTKTMIASQHNNRTHRLLKRILQENVDFFTYLSRKITAGGKYKKEIECHIKKKLLLKNYFQQERKFKSLQKVFILR